MLLIFLFSCTLVNKKQKVNLSQSKKPKATFGIALSGGGARGIAHIGVLDALEKYGISPGIISGTSMGAIVGVFYAAGFEPKEILEIVSSRKFHKIVNWHLPLSGLVDIDRVLKTMEKKIEKDSFSALKKPFYCAVANLNSGELEIRSDGKLFQWVLASVSIPVIFEPQVIEGQTYVDGGLLDNLPARPIRDKCKMLIGVNANHNGPQENVEGVKTVAERCFRLGIARNITESLSVCDFLIEPPQTRAFNTFSFSKAKEIYQVGYDYAEKSILDAFDSVDMEKIAGEMKKNRQKQ